VWRLTEKLLQFLATLETARPSSSKSSTPAKLAVTQETQQSISVENKLKRADDELLKLDEEIALKESELAKIKADRETELTMLKSNRNKKAEAISHARKVLEEVLAKIDL